MDVDNVDNPMASNGKMFVAQIIQELEMEKLNNAQTFLDNLSQFGLDGLPGMMLHNSTIPLGDIPCFPDVPAILVDNNDSVCYHCAKVEEHKIDNAPELDEETNDSKKLEKKAKHHLWQTLVGNGIINRTQLQQKLEAYLLCFQCMQEQLDTSKCVEEICLDDAMLVASTSNVGLLAHCWSSAFMGITTSPLSLWVYHWQ